MNEKIKQIISNARKEKRRKLLEHESMDILNEYGIPVAPYYFLDANQELPDDLPLEFPVVAKIVSPDIVHKSDVGGVIVGIKNMEELRDSIKKIYDNVKVREPEARIKGILLQKMMPKGLEVIVGGIRDPVFDAAVMFGLGGVFVEVFKDVSFRIAPISEEDAMEMINEIKAKNLLHGFRGMPARDIRALVDILVKSSILMSEVKEITEMDINPVISYDKGAVAVDARFIIKIA